MIKNLKNPLEKQYQLEYAMYMMFASYFKKVTCMSPRIEKKLFLYYQDLNRKEQEKLEESVLNVINKYLCIDLSVDNIEEIEARIYFIPLNHGNIIRILGEGLLIDLIAYKDGGVIKYMFDKVDGKIHTEKKGPIFNTKYNSGRK